MSEIDSGTGETMSERIHVGFLVGTRLPGNVRTLLRNIRRLLRSRDRHFECDLLISEGIDIPDGYRVCRITHEPVETARDRLRTLRDAANQYLTEENPEVLMQVTLFPIDGTAAALAGRRTDIPVVTRLAGEDFREYQFSMGLDRKLRTFALNNVISLAAVHLPDAVVVLGPKGRSDIARRLRRRNVWEIPQPVDSSKFKPGDAGDLRESLGIAADERLLLTVGRVSRRKGAETIREVAPSFDGTWLVVGDGSMRETLADTPGVRTTGRVPHDQIVDYYRAADLYVHPSLHDGLPNVLLEATACGTPCIARDVGECESVAVETFTNTDGLRAALSGSYEPVELGEQFREEHLAERYDDLLAEVAR